MPDNSDVEGGVGGAVGGILLEPLQWHQLLTPKGWKRLTTEGHTFADAILTVAMAQIGMLLEIKLLWIPPDASVEQYCQCHTQAMHADWPHRVCQETGHIVSVRTAAYWQRST